MTFAGTNKHFFKSIKMYYIIITKIFDYNSEMLYLSTN